MNMSLTTRRSFRASVTCLILIPLTFVACAEKNEARTEESVPVRVAMVEQKEMPVELTAIGTVEPMETVAIRSQVTGQLERVWFQEGQEVRRGQLLFTIDRRPLQAAMAQAQAALSRDQAQLRNAESQAARYADLVKKDYVTREENDRIRAAAESARAVIASDRAAADNARVQLSYSEIHSPVNGRTGSLLVHSGNLVRANDTAPLVTINQIAPIRVTFSAPQSQLASLHTVNAPPVRATVAGSQQEQHGTLTFIDNAVDPSTGTIALKATFDNTNRTLWPGQFVNVQLLLERRNGAFVIPSTAVQSGQRGTFVYVVKADKGVEIRPVKVEREVGLQSIIASGLAAGENVVIDGQLRLNPKSKVAVKTAGASRS